MLEEPIISNACVTELRLTHQPAGIARSSVVLFFHFLEVFVSNLMFLTSV